jgi:hypothetical protein
MRRQSRFGDEAFWSGASIGRRAGFTRLDFWETNSGDFTSRNEVAF